MENFELEISDLGMNGEGIGHFENLTCFVPYALKDEKVEVSVKKRKDTLCFCKLEKVLSKSDVRQTPKCPYFAKCGGCDLQHLKYENSLDFKTDLVKNTLLKIARLNVEVCKTISSDKHYEYRTKNVFPVGIVNGKTVVGMFEKGTHSIIEIEKCFLANEKTNAVLQAVSTFFKNKNVQGYNFATHKGLVKFVMIQTLGEKVLVTLVCTKQPNFLQELVQTLKPVCDFGLFCNINKKEGSEILFGEMKHICGLSQLQDKLFEIEYEISPFSFMQVNQSVKEKLYSFVLNHIKKDDVVVDAYSGAGLLSCMMAKKCKKVVGIEIVKSAVINANKTKDKNGIKNLENVCGDCGAELGGIVERENPNTIVLDPPQKGCDEQVLKQTLNSGAQKVIYISCNPKTLARDLLLLQEKFDVCCVQPFDMFPQTACVETCVILGSKSFAKKV